MTESTQAGWWWAEIIEGESKGIGRMRRGEMKIWQKFGRNNFGGQGLKLEQVQKGVGGLLLLLHCPSPPTPPPCALPCLFSFCATLAGASPCLQAALGVFVPTQTYNQYKKCFGIVLSPIESARLRFSPPTQTRALGGRGSCYISSRRRHTKTVKVRIRGQSMNKFVSTLLL